MENIRINHEHRIITVVGPRFKGDQIQLIDMDHPSASLNYSLEFGDLRKAKWQDWPAHMKIKIDARMRTNPRDSEIELKSISKAFFVDDGRLNLFLSFQADRGTLDVAVPLDQIYPSWYPKTKVVSGLKLDQLNSHLSGFFGVPMISEDSQMAMGVDGKTAQFDGEKYRSIGIPVPPIAASVKNVQLRILAKSAKWAVLSIHNDPKASHEGDGHSELHVWNYQSSQWSQFSVPGGLPGVNLDGQWLTAAAVSQCMGRTSPGLEQRRTLQVKGKRTLTDDEFHGYGMYYYPGVLTLINVQDKRRYEIRTNQGDSEILFVHDGNVYYRISEDLFRAPIEQDGIGSPVKIASGAVVGESHLAFWSDR